MLLHSRKQRKCSRAGELVALREEAWGYRFAVLSLLAPHLSRSSARHCRPKADLGPWSGEMLKFHTETPS